MACTCQMCGRKYKIDLNIPNDLWEMIKPIEKPQGGGLLCGACIMEKLEQHLDYSVFKLSKKTINLLPRPDHPNYVERMSNELGNLM